MDDKCYEVNKADTRELGRGYNFYLSKDKGGEGINHTDVCEECQFAYRSQGSVQPGCSRKGGSGITNYDRVLMSISL